MDNLQTEAMHPLSISSEPPKADPPNDDLSVPPAMRRPAFIAATPSCHWLSSTWTEIREEVSTLINSVEATIQTHTLTTEAVANIMERKRALETAMRRRTRVVEEVWRAFVCLQRIHNRVLNGYLTTGAGAQSCSSVRFQSPRLSNQTVFPGRTNSSASGDIVQFPIQAAFPDDGTSLFQMVSKTVIRCGVELELYDEDTPGINRIAGAGIGLAVFAVICTIVYYY